MARQEIVNAKITGTMLGVEDHSIFTAYVYVEGAGWGGGFGGYSFDGWREEGRARIALNGFGIEFIRGVLRVAGVESWEKLKGAHVRVETEGLGGGIILRMGHILKDDWFDPKALAESMHEKVTA